MKYMYTTKPDEGCREVSPGIYGRPVHTSHQSGLRKQGWVYSINDIEVTHVRKEKEGRQEEVEVSESFTLKDMAGYANQIAKTQAFKEGRDELAEKYEAKFGKPPHHKMKAETIRKKLEADDEQ